MTAHAVVTLPTDQGSTNVWGALLNADLADLARAANGAVDDAAAAQTTASGASTAAGTAQANAAAASALATTANNGLASKVTAGAGVVTIVKITQAAYNALGASAVATTLYLIVG